MLRNLPRSARFGILVAAALAAVVALIVASRTGADAAGPIYFVIAGLAFSGLIEALRRVPWPLAARRPRWRGTVQDQILFEANPHPMWVYDTETLRFLDVNEAAVRAYGHSRDEFLTMTIEAIHPPEDLPALRNRLDDGRDQPFHNVSGWRHRLNDGTILEVEINSSAVVFDGRAARLVLAVDVTARKRAEQALTRSESRAHRLAGSNLIGVAFLDEHGLVVEANDAFLGIVGYSRNDLSTMSLRWPQLVSTGPNPLALSPSDATRDGQAVRREVQLTRKDGANVAALIGLVGPEQAGDESVCFALELTGLRQAEQQRDQLLSAERQALAAARQSERRYRLLASAIPQVVWTADADGQADYFNPRWLSYTGLPKAQSQGRGWRSALHPEDGPRLEAAWARARDVSQPFTLDLRLRRTDGIYRWHLLSMLPARGSSGSADRWLGTFTDIEDQKQAEGVLAFLAESGSLLGSSLDARTILTRLAWLVVRRVADLCQIDLVDEPGTPLRRIASAHADDREPDGVRLADTRGLAIDDAHPALRVVRSGKPEWANREAGPSTKNGSGEAGPWEAFGTPGVTSYLCVPLHVRDRTLGAISLVMADSGRQYGPADRALAEQLARRAAAAVDNARLYLMAEQDRRDAEAANRTKDRFLAILSHELRTPLTPVLLAASALLEDPDLPPRVRPVLEMTQRNVELEARLIGDLLDVSRIAAGKLHLTRELTDAHAVIWRALETCRPELHASGVVLEVDLAADEHHLQADPARLQQVVWNLVKNALKFTPAGGDLFVRTANRTAPGGDPERPGLIVEVEDTGVGIDPEVLPKVFDAFEQGGDTAASRKGGLGLGLAISRAVAEAHDGRISVASGGRGQGATFTLDLPTVPAPLGADGAPITEVPAVPAAPQRILLVEDNADARRNLTWILEGRGHTVFPAENLAAAREAAGCREFDLLISDIELPDGSGLDLMRRLGGPDGMPGIALSGYGTEDDVQDSLKAGFTEHLTKPVIHATLEAAIKRVTAAASTKPRPASAACRSAETPT